MDVMERAKLRKIISDFTRDVEALVNKVFIISAKETIFAMIELLVSEVESLRGELQKLRNENNRLKGEQGKPAIRKQTQGNTDISSESERKSREEKKERQSKKKRHKIEVDRVEVCEVNKGQLPPDAQFKGYQDVVVQDLVICTDNVKFKKEIYYSASLNKTFIAALPTGYKGEFGPRIKALVLDLYHTGGMSESAILSFLTTQGLHISAATISRMLTDKHDVFHQEKAAIVEAGRESTAYQQMDDTGARVRGKNGYAHILCNEYYTAYSTRGDKSRLTIIDVLTQGKTAFLFDDSSYALMKEMKLSDRQLRRLKEWIEYPVTILKRQQVEGFLNKFFPNPLHYHESCRQKILEGAAIASYRQRFYETSILLTDDAPQFRKITPFLGLCWIHDGRHYKKLSPWLEVHETAMKSFLDQYWDYYKELLHYKKQPSATHAKVLEKKFDTLFSTKTKFHELNWRIEATKQKKKELLLVLQYPELPLHNNTSELGARRVARHRDISFQTMTGKGTRAKDTFMTITETAKKQGVNTYGYFFDRISQGYKLPSLASLVRSRGNALPQAPPT